MSMKASRDAGFPDPSRGGRTRRSEADACDVNRIVAMHKRGLVTSHITSKVGAYGFAPAVTFQDCMNRVREAQETFALLPSKTREYFANDPARFVEFASDPKNVEKLVELNLAVPKEPAPGPAKVEVVNLPPTPPAA